MLVPCLDDAVVLRARYSRQRLALHSHPTYVLALIVDGALRFRCDTETLVAPTGSVCLINPDQVQTGEAASEAGWSYLSAYVPVSVFVDAGNRSHPKNERPRFARQVLTDEATVRLVAGFFAGVRSAPPSLARSELLLGCLSSLVEREATKPMPATKHVDLKLVRGAKEILAESFGSSVQIDELAQPLGVTGFHLTRVFKKSTGLALHAWLVQYRAERARAMLLGGAPIADTAVACGFADQPHMTRWFRRLFGMTPGDVRTMSRTFKIGAFPSR